MAARRSARLVMRRLAIAAVVIDCAVAVMHAQQTALFRGGIEVVELDVSVMRGGQPVIGLTARDFSLTDEGVPQRLESVTLDTLPLSVMLALDTSTSVSGERLRHLLDAGDGLTRALRPDDRAALITFSHAVDLVVPMTGNLNAVRQTLSRIHPGGSTALRDAVQLALELRPRDTTRPLLLVFTDGKDTASWLSAEALLDSARRVGIVVHVVRVESDSFLDQLAQATGGRTWSATSDRQLRELFTRALEEMRARYLITYTPRGVQKPGWHTLKVKLNNGSADVSARPGYFVAAPLPSR
jgi:Ca-activated chloride channel family protein